jgi:hypothetical protein
MLSDARRNLLEKYLQGDFATPSQELPPIVRRMPRESAPVSYGQQQVWLHAQMAPNLPLYNEPVTIHRIGPLDVPALERAFNEIVRRHEAWRTSFQTVDGQPVQVVHPPPYISLPVSDLRSLPEAVREAEALKIATEDSRVPLDMASVPLFRVRLIRLGDEEHRLFLTLSHIIFDGVAIYRVFLPAASRNRASGPRRQHGLLAETACWPVARARTASGPFAAVHPDVSRLDASVCS